MISDIYIKTHRDPTVIEELAMIRGKRGYDLFSITPTINLGGELLYTLVMVSYDTSTNRNHTNRGD